MHKNIISEDERPGYYRTGMRYVVPWGLREKFVEKSGLRNYLNPWHQICVTSRMVKNRYSNQPTSYEDGWDHVPWRNK